MHFSQEKCLFGLVNPCPMDIRTAWLVTALKGVMEFP